MSRRVVVSLAAWFGALVLVAVPAAAHVKVDPSSASQGSYTVLTFRVPNEEADADTVGLKVQLPVDHPLASVVVMIAWQWLPFATLIFMTALQSMNREQLEAARMDGANYPQQLRYMYLPHLGRPIAVVVMIETIFLLSVFAEIFTTTGGGPGDASTNVAFLIFKQALLNFDAGVASAGALFAVVLANIAAIFLIRMVGKNLD